MNTLNTYSNNVFFDNFSIHSIHIMNSISLVSQDVMDSYMHIVYEYIDAFESFIAKGAAVYPDCMFYIGMNIVNKVYVYIFMKYGNVKPASYYSQKAYVYFIEYMEQIHVHGLALTIKYNDAILFIYNKTIFELSNDDTQNPTDTMSNIFSLQSAVSVCNMKECIGLLHDMHHYINIILNWKNTTITTDNRIFICKQLFPSLMQFTSHYEITSGYLEYIHCIINMPFEKYCDFLKEISHKLNCIPNIRCKSVDKFIIQKCYIERDILCEKIEEDTMYNVVAWLYEPIRK